MATYLHRIVAAVCSSAILIDGVAASKADASHICIEDDAQLCPRDTRDFAGDLQLGEESLQLSGRLSSETSAEDFESALHIGEGLLQMSAHLPRGVARNITAAFSDLFPSAEPESLDSWLPGAINVSKLFWEGTDPRVVKLFNPSVYFLENGSQRFVARLSNDSRCCSPEDPLKYCALDAGKGVIVDCSTVHGHPQCTKMWSDEELNVVSPIHPPPVPTWGDRMNVGDPHAFTMDGHPMSLMNNGVWARCQIRLVNLTSSTVYSLEFGGSSECEKNWSPFIHNGELYFSWWIQPYHKVLHCSLLPNTQRYLCDIAFVSPNNLPVPPTQDMEVHLGTPAVIIDDYFVAMAHSSIDNDNYVGVLYAFQRFPPFRVVAQSPWFRLPIMAADEKGEWSHIIYPGGLVRRGAELVVSYGVGDCHSRYVRLSMPDVKRALGI